MKRFQARRGNGRFTRNTPENTLGMHMNIHERQANGDWCGAFNPSSVGEPRPTVCHACGESLHAEAEREKGKPMLSCAHAFGETCAACDGSEE